ncbi:hypothetical protein SASPL_139273 [Salvia splendens]|uniref:Uncharacterized protein n=1 Tax=Salvia splendens TaxID=180675 RepID=A0A8X8WN34_SALSN|nr:hypothetical protein SASPL_139273 [Salvia splendens]
MIYYVKRKMGGHLYPATQASRLKRLTSNIPFSTIRRFKHGSEGHGIDKERAPTTAEEFERVAEEKSRQGFSSRKASDSDGDGDGVGASQPQPLKEAFKEATDFHKRGVDQR